MARLAPPGAASWRLLAELALVLGAATALLVRVRLATPHDVLSGLDAWQYLGNALAVAEGDAALFHPWRGPLHAWILAALMGPVGSLREAAAWVSALGVAGMVPLCWWLGRTLAGPVAGLLGALLLAATPELVPIGASHGAYGLFALLCSAGFALACAARGSPGWIGAGVLFGLAALCDGRGLVFAGAAAAGLLLARQRWQGRVGPALLLLLAFGLVRVMAIPLQPVEPLPVAEQVQVQRARTAKAGKDLPCPLEGPARVGPGLLVDDCGRAVMARNLETLGGALPPGGWLWALPLLGLVRLRRSRGAWPAAVPLAAVVALLPMGALVLLPPRYLLPVGAPIAASLAAGALLALRPLGRWWRLDVALAVALLGLLALERPLAQRQLSDQPPGFAPSTLVAGVARAVELRAEEGDPVYDCAQLHLRLFMAPWPVSYGPVAKGLRRFNPLADERARWWQQACAALPLEGAREGRPAWLVLRSERGVAAPDPAHWTEVERVEHREGGRTVVRVYRSVD